MHKKRSVKDIEAILLTDGEWHAVQPETAVRRPKGGFEWQDPQSGHTVIATARAVVALRVGPNTEQVIEDLYASTLPNA